MIGRLLKMVNDAIERNANNSLRRNGLTFVQVQSLVFLSEKDEGSCSFKELEAFLDVAQSTCVGIVSRMERKKLVEVFIDPVDRRAKRLRLTSEGDECCRKMLSDVEDIESLVARGFSEEERLQLESFLKRIYANVK